ncbi:MAG: site-specific integrase [Acidobacteria bacterium]|nr:site-specific integrase [Acidobacteriota bacterium]
MGGPRNSPRNGLATLIAYAAGLRAHELLTLARPDERPPDVRPARLEKFDGRPGTDYTVVGKGGLVRVVRIPDDLAARLEERRLDEPVRVSDREIRYQSRYDIAGGEAWSRSFSRASESALGWSRGAHGLRHSYAQERMAELQRGIRYDDALEVVSQELGHFRPGITREYLR